ncbi:hypothetical protein GJ744_004905 [Endocarpon pusillum]|uniref:C2H2-type domain-containing protein n=1 Tax=Endocarpon pusillum TaxID=364733 RepID=A0A8H7AUG7_9EURO|nr:hypothetical protein GJ744_004905 [Endocarpon pusillum]
MECQHCGKSFSEVSAFEAHTSWHTERQAQLQRRPRKYTTHERPPSGSTNRSIITSHSNRSGPCAPVSASTTEFPSSPSKSQNIAKVPIVFSEHSTPDFDFNFDTISPLPPTSSHSLPIIKTLTDVVARFPAFDIEQTGDTYHTTRDYKCVDCEAIFSTQKDCDLHTQSRFCPGSAALAFALYRDVRQPGGYRIDRKYLPFNGQYSSIKCQKCHLSFSNRLQKKVHELSHPSAQIECLHCEKLLSTTTELESHYQWHDDMEHRHRRNKCRRKLPGLKLQSKALRKRQSTAGVADFGGKSVFLADEDLSVIPENAVEDGRGQDSFEPDKELVAISFISPEDLERIHAPNGVFREVEPFYLHRQEEIRTVHVADALDALEGNSPSQTSSRCTTSSTEKGEQPCHSLKPDEQVERTDPQSNGLKKRSSIRKLFRRAKSEPQLESNMKQRSSFRHTFRRDSTVNEALVVDGRLMLSAVLQKVSTAANKGDLKTVRKECDRLMAMTTPAGSDADSSMIPVQAYAFPEGTLIQDTAGNARYITAETVNEITSALRHTPVTSWAKTKVSVLSTRAFLSSQDGDYGDAVWCYRQVLNLLREHPMLFPDVIWHAAILSNLAHLSARLNRPDDEERYYLKALAISYNRYGRKDLNNINFLTALAAAYEENDQTPQAAEVYKRSLFARMEISGPGENDTLMAMQELAAVYTKMGSLTVAQLLYEQCLGGFETQLGLDHKVTLLIVDRLCNIYVQQKAHDEALALYGRAFPHLLNVCGPDDELPRNWVCEYMQHTRNYDFPPDVSALLQSYRTHPTEMNLWVLQNLARIYMLAGLLPDASDLFDFVYNARRELQGEYNPTGLDALHGHCLALECMDSIDAAHYAYTNLVQLALRSPDAKDGRTRALNVRARLGALQERKKVLAGEKEAWGLKSTGPCGTCKYQTNLLCQKCHISRFCCEACRDLSSRSHDPACHPSVTLCQSKSVTAIPNVPHRIEKQVINHLSNQNIRRGMKAKIFRVSNSFTFNYDPRNFTTFRLKFNSQVDTFLSFNRDADIRFAIVDPSPPKPSTSLPLESAKPSFLRTPIHGLNGSQPPSSRTSWETDTTNQDFQWTTPPETETLLLPKGKDAYLVVTPGEKLFEEMVRKRRQVRRGDSEGLEHLSLPDEALMRYCQGLVLKGQERRRFCYLVEVES